MPEPKQKDWFDIAIDFFFGALISDVVYGLAVLRGGGRSGWLWRWDTVSIILFAITLIAGSLAALFRNQFWSHYETYSIIPPMEETVSKPAKIILWLLFAIGCASLGLLFIL
jgi:hypothetical protein